MVKCKLLTGLVVKGLNVLTMFAELTDSASRSRQSMGPAVHKLWNEELLMLQIMYPQQK